MLIGRPCVSYTDAPSILQAHDPSHSQRQNRMELKVAALLLEFSIFVLFS